MLRASLQQLRGSYHCGRRWASLHSTRYRKRFGQHILKSASTLQRIVDAAGIRPTDVVLEIGPGTGNLTERILNKRPARVVAVELDARMVSELNFRFMHAEPDVLQVVHGDILRDQLPAFDVCVANLPYQISSPLMDRLWEALPFRRAVIMFQDEFARRLFATPGTSDYTRLSVATQLHAKVTPLFKVPPGAFQPPPKVQSRVVALEPLVVQPSAELVKDMAAVLRMAFARKNKTLRAVARQRAKAGRSRQELWHAFMELVDSSPLATMRAQHMTEAEFLSLLELFKQAGLAPSVRAAAEGAAVVQESDDMDYADDSDLKMNR